MSHNLNDAVAVVGIDIGKNSFHVVGLGSRGAIVLRQKWSRGQVEARFANMPPCLIGMEACVGAHHLSRYSGRTSRQVREGPVPGLHAAQQKGGNGVVSRTERLINPRLIRLGSFRSLIRCGSTRTSRDGSHQSGGGGGCFGFGPNARAVSRCGRLTLDRASCRAYSRSPSSLYCGLVSEARNATTSSISGSVSANGCMSLSSHGFVIPSPLL